MTVSSTSSRKVYLGDGTVTEFGFPFKVQQPTDLVVVYTDATGTEFTLSPSQYGASGFGADAGGKVAYPLSGAPIASGTTLTIYRRVEITQLTSISNQGAMWPQVIEKALDRLTYMAQSVSDAVSRSLSISPTDGDPLSPLPSRKQRANTVLGFDSAGQPYAAQLVAGAGLAAASSWLVANFFPVSSPAAARGVLGAIAPGDNTAFSGTNTFPTQGAADNSTKVATTAYADRAAGSVVVRAHLAGFGLSNDATTPNTVLDIAPGVCADSTNAVMIQLAGTLAKSVGGAWAAGAGQNGMGTGVTVANNSWYHVFAIVNGGASDVYFDTSITAANKPANTTAFRRIGSIRTDGSARIRAFVQNGDSFRWVAPTVERNAFQPGATTRQSQTLAGVPAGLVVFPQMIVQTASGGGGGCSMLMTSLDEADTAISQGVNHSSAPTAGVNGAAVPVVDLHTNTSAQVAYKISAADGYIFIITTGWLDRRGRDS